MRAIIFANGRLEYPRSAIEIIKTDDLLIAADGGARHCRKIGIRPMMIIGDLDSLRHDEVCAFENEGVQIIRYSARKNNTDLDLAFRVAKERGVREIIVFGGVGDRWDMTLSNLFLSTDVEFEDMDIRFIDGPQEACLVRGGEEKTLHGSMGDRFSILPIGDEATGITLQGLEYPLDGATLHIGSSKGISNVFIGDEAYIKLGDGLVMCVVNRKI